MLLLATIDKWLREEYSNGKNDSVIIKSREQIEKIIKRGYYNSSERDLLNELRSQWIKYKKNEKT